jgi:hypothetical protein
LSQKNGLVVAPSLVTLIVCVVDGEVIVEGRLRGLACRRPLLQVGEDAAQLPRQLRDDVGHYGLAPDQLGLQLLAQDGQRGRLPRQGALVLGRDVEFFLVAAQDVVSRQIQRIGSIKSHAILGGLHHHYART